jgi:recombination protein RecA
MYNEGISTEGDIVDLGSALEIISKRGAFFSFNDQRIGQGRENAKAYLRAHPDVAAEIEAQIRAQTIGKAPISAPSGDDEMEQDN